MSGGRRPGWVPVLVLVALVVPGCSGATASRTPDPSPPPTTAAGSPSPSPADREPGPVVLLVHGFSSTDEGYSCAGYWGAVEAAFRRWMPSARTVTVAYERGDHDCDVRIGSDDPDTPIGAIGRQLARHVFDAYSSHRAPVLLVGHSMGGLIVRAAVAGAGGPRAPFLLVPRAVTIASPHAGAPAAQTCPEIEQCREQTPGSAFLRDLEENPQGRGGTVWSVFGSVGDELVPARSAVAMEAAHRVIFLRPPYSHVTILVDGSVEEDATWQVLGPDGTTTVDGRPRSLRAVFLALTDG